MTEDEIVNLGDRAERLLNDELMRKAFDSLREAQFQAFESSKTPAEREEAHHLLQAINRLKIELGKHISRRQHVRFYREQAK